MVVRRVPPSTPLQPTVVCYFSFVLGVALAALPSTKTDLRTELAVSGKVVWTEVYVNPIINSVVPATPRVGQNEVTPVAVDGLGIRLHKPSAEAARVRFSHDGEEPACGRLYAAQKLVRSMRAAAIFVVAVTSAHCRLHQTGTNEWRATICPVRRICCVVQLRREEGSPLSPWCAVLAEVRTRPRGVHR